MIESPSLSGEAPEKTLRDHVEILVRRWKSAAWTLTGVFAAAALAALLWPATYRSTATILIEQQEIPQDLVRSAITSFADQRIEQISARVMTTSNLLDIVREHGLYADDFDREPREVIIERMRDDILREMISADVVDPRSGRPVEATIAFTVGFESRSPALAARVANELTNLFLDENIASRRDQAAETTAFFIEEAARLNEEIATLEAALAEFKRANVNVLPEQTPLNLQLRNRTELDIVEVQRERSVLEERRIYLESELAQLSPSRDLVDGTGALLLNPRDRLRALEAQRAAMRGVRSDDHPSTIRMESQIAALEAELGIESGDATTVEALRDELALAHAERERLLDLYPSLHSDVVRQDRRIGALEEEIAATEGRLAASAAPAVDAEADNPVYVQLRAQLTATEMELVALVDKETELEARLADLEDRMAQAPIVEREYYAMTRDIDTARAKYQEASLNARGAETAENLEMDDKGERFTLIEPALLPQQPVSPNRKLIVLLGVVVSIGAAVAAVALIEALDTSIRSPAELKRLTALPPLGVIPLIVTADDRRARSRRRVQVACAAVAGAMVLAAAVHFLYMPIDDLWFRVLRRMGA